jgi:hypothetical protein
MISIIVELDQAVMKKLDKSKVVTMSLSTGMFNVYLDIKAFFNENAIEFIESLSRHLYKYQFIFCDLLTSLMTIWEMESFDPKTAIVRYYIDRGKLFFEFLER